MAPSAEPVAQLANLPKADGSATYSYQGYTVTSAVNGPIEAPKREESAFDAQVDVVVRPAAGVGGTAERQLEAILQAALRQLIPVRKFPRCMIQITLQVVASPENAYENAKIVQSHLNLVIIPALLHAAILGLLTAAVPLKLLATATTLAIPAAAEGRIVVEPSAVEASRARSVHALGFTSDDELLLAESEGAFSPEEWARVLEAGERVCCRTSRDGGDERMEDGGDSGGITQSASVRDFIRSVTEGKLAEDLAWRS